MSDLRKPPYLPAVGDDEGWCKHYKELDRVFKTETNSPLHHDNRCPIHTENPRYKRR